MTKTTLDFIEFPVFKTKPFQLSKEKLFYIHKKSIDLEPSGTINSPRVNLFYYKVSK